MRRSFGNRLISCLLAALLALTLAVPALADTADDAHARGLEILDLLAQGDYEAVQAMFAPAVSSMLSAEQLEAVWAEQVLAICGTFESVLQDAVVEQEGYFIYQALAQYSQWTAQVVITLDGDLGVYGLQCAPVEQVAAQEAVLPAGIVEEDVIVDADGKYPLAGKLTLPEGAQGPLPAVVLVHGSGASDMNETAYTYKPFQDIAWALAQRGYAVIRYDKRTYTYAQEMMDETGGAFTVWEETIADALAAQALLADDARIDSEHIYVLGHSMGGMLAPRIITESDGGFAGGILMSGTLRTLVELIVDQTEYAIETTDLDEATIATLRESVAQAQAIYDQLADLDDEDAKQVSIYGASGYYFKEMDAHPSADYLAALECPLFIFQGNADMQVYADKDFVLYESLAEGRDNITLKLYEGLNHFLHPSTTQPPSALEYYTPTEMSAEVLSDIADWLDAQTK